MQRNTLRVVVITGSMLAFTGVPEAQSVQVPEPAPAAQVAEPAPTASGPADAANTTQETAEPNPVQERAVSQVRIVRLSQVRGVVQMDRNTGRGYEPAFANIPVIGGARLRTGQGVAEVEFEDNSSLRLAPDSEVRFSQLGRLDSGGTETTIDVVKGLVYVGLEKTKGNQFSLTEGPARVELLPGAHLRLDASKPQAQLAVFDGAAELRVGEATTQLTKKQTVTITPATQTVSAVVHGTEAGDWDEWDRQEVGYHKQRASFAGNGGSGLYGANDLGYYGSFVDMPGCGSMWRPYFASAAWDPFSSGVWTYYQGAGYSWVSPYPWGWLPYHSGSWASCGSAGWGWRPGSNWYGLNNLTAMRIGGRPLPHPVPSAPARNAATLVPVNMKQITSSGPSTAGGFAFRRDSAGIGVPRATFGNLHSVADHVARSGEVTRGMPVATFAGAPMSAHQVGGGTNNVRAGAMPGASQRTASNGTRSMGQSSSSMGSPSTSSMGGMRGGGGSMPSGGASSGGGSHK